MRLVATFILAAAVATALTTDARAQCQRGGQRAAQARPGSFLQPTTFTRAGFNPALGAQQAAALQQVQLAMLQQQTALQGFRRQQQRSLAQADQERLARKRASATARRAAVLAQRERARQRNLARLDAGRRWPEEPVEAPTLVALLTE